MGKVIGIALFVIAIWLGMRTFVTDGPGSDPEQASARPAQRVGERVQDAIDSGSERTEQLLPE